MFGALATALRALPGSDGTGSTGSVTVAKLGRSVTALETDLQDVRRALVSVQADNGPPSRTHRLRNRFARTALAKSRARMPATREDCVARSGGWCALTCLSSRLTYSRARRRPSRDLVWPGARLFVDFPHGGRSLQLASDCDVAMDGGNLQRARGHGGAAPARRIAYAPRRGRSPPIPRSNALRSRRGSRTTEE
jgi:hypothetical protein